MRADGGSKEDEDLWMYLGAEQWMRGLQTRRCRGVW